MKLFSLYITNEQHEKLIKLSGEVKIPMAEIIRRAIESALEGKWKTDQQ